MVPISEVDELTEYVHRLFEPPDGERGDGERERWQSLILMAPGATEEDFVQTNVDALEEQRSGRLYRFRSDADADRVLEAFREFAYGGRADLEREEWQRIGPYTGLRKFLYPEHRELLLTLGVILACCGVAVLVGWWLLSRVS